MFAGLGTALVSGGLSYLGGMMSQDKTDERQRMAQEFNAAEAEKNRDFQERMSSSAYQRSMVDMRAAGLNPILAYQKGPASSPSGATASTTFSPAMDVVTPAVSSAMQAFRLKHEVENMVSTNANLQETNKNLQSENMRINASTANIHADTKIKNEIFETALREATKAKTDEELYSSPIGRVMRLIGTTMRELGVSKSIPSSHISIKPYKYGE